MHHSLYDPIKADITAVEQLIRQTLLQSGSPLVTKMNEYIISSPGKRLRPALCLLAFRLQSDFSPIKLEKAIQIAAAIELIHMASLVHDDIIDKASFRHSKPSINSKWGDPLAMTFGVHLYAKALELIAMSEDNDILKKISEAVQALCEGEMNQIHNRWNFDLKLADFMNLLEGKTAALFQVACYAGCKIAGAAPDMTGRLTRFGREIGIVFQIVDDYMDVFSEHSQLGKKPGQDLEMGDLTLPIYYLLDRLTESERRETIAILRQADEQAYRYVQEKIRLRDDIRVDIETLVRGKVDIACRELDPFMESSAKSSLIKITDYILERGLAVPA